jgi:hypothetical protein
MFLAISSASLSLTICRGRERQLPSIVCYVLMTASRSREFGELLKAKQLGVQVTSKVLEGPRYVLGGMVESRAGGLIVEQILPRALGLQIDFEMKGNRG